MFIILLYLYCLTKLSPISLPGPNVAHVLLIAWHVISFAQSLMSLPFNGTTSKKKKHTTSTAQLAAHQRLANSRSHLEAEKLKEPSRCINFE
jgi:hypothetical protein